MTKCPKMLYNVSSMPTHTTHSAEETMLLGKQVAQTAEPGTIICLHGDLGAGKTTFTKGLAQGLGITSDIKSPTFTLMNIYEITPQTGSRSQREKLKIENLIHIDTYRLKNEHELLEIGIEDYLGEPGTLTLVEWPEKLPTLLQNKKVVNITINHLTENSREVIID